MPEKCEDCNIRPIDKTTNGRYSRLCGACWKYAGWENQHSDDSHDNPSKMTRLLKIQMDDCPVCHPELDPREEVHVPIPRPAQQGNKNAAGKQMSHAECSHPKTKAARQKCRTERRKNGETVPTPHKPSVKTKRIRTQRERAEMCIHGDIWGSCAYKNCPHSRDYEEPLKPMADYTPEEIMRKSGLSEEEITEKTQTPPADECPTCGKSGDEKCVSGTGKPLKNKGARHANRP